MTGPNLGSVAARFELKFVAEFEAVDAGGRLLLSDAPLRIANKANARILGAGRRRYGGPEWHRIQIFERSVRAAALEAVADFEREVGQPWPASADGYVVELVLEFGDRAERVEPEGPRRAPYWRTIRGATRCRRFGVDSVKSVLDAMQGPVFADDERTTALAVRKIAKEGPGDRVRVRVRVEVETPIRRGEISTEPENIEEAP